jgi:hypothetical protein
MKAHNRREDSIALVSRVWNITVARATTGAILVGLVGAGLWSCGGGSGASAPDRTNGGVGSSGSGAGTVSDAASSSSSGGNGGSSGGTSSDASGGFEGGGSSGSSGAGNGSSGMGGSPDSGPSSSGGSSSGVASSSSGGPGTSGGVAFSSDHVVVTGVRNTTASPATTVVSLHNGGPTTVQITSLSLGGADQTLFEISGPPALPAALMPGQDLLVTVRMLTTGATLPAAPANKDTGSNLLTANLTATAGSGSAQASVYGLLLIQNNWEPTLGQILTTLGYKLNVGQAQNNWNPNTSMMATNLPGIEAGTDEVAAPHFVKAAAGSVTMSVVARFSPVGVLPYGWYPKGSSSTRNVVGTMSQVTDPQTSDKARMVLPPPAAGSSTTFDPGSAPFGVWVYSDQATQKYATGNAVNGDYDYTEDALNAPANVHRVKTYPLKDATGASIAQNYLVAVEEAGNGDYQDYVFVLGNVNVAP